MKKYKLTTLFLLILSQLWVTLESAVPEVLETTTQQQTGPNTEKPTSPPQAYFSLVQDVPPVSPPAAAPNSSNPTTKPELSSQEKAKFIVSMMRDAWRVDEKPLLTVIFSLSTLWVMGLSAEFEEARKRVQKMTGTEIRDKMVLQMTINPLLSAYALTGDELFRTKAILIANKFKGKAKERLNLWECYYYGMAFRYLSHLTGETDYWQEIRQFMKTMTFVRVVPEKYKIIIGMQYFLQSNKSLKAAFKMAKDEIKSLSIHVSQGNFTYVAESMQSNGTMKSIDCRLSAFFALNAHILENTLGTSAFQTQSRKAREPGALLRLNGSDVRQQWTLAKNITETCHLATATTKTGLPPMSIGIPFINPEVEKEAFGFGAYEQDYQIPQSYFTLWRLTGERKYRDFAWELALAIDRRARAKDGGFIMLKDINAQPPPIDNKPAKHKQRIELMAGTFMYLYATFAEQSVLPLDKWVFAPIGQPMPICGQNSAFLAQNCTMKDDDDECVPDLVASCK